MSVSKYTNVKIDKRNRIATVTLDRSEAVNSLNLKMRPENRCGRCLCMLFSAAMPVPDVEPYLSRLDPRSEPRLNRKPDGEPI